MKNWAFSTLIIILLALGLTNTLDNNAQSQLETAFGNALKTFAVVRGLNAVISVVQGTEIALEPGGIGVVLTPGEILDPANDLIERFSWIVLMAGTSLGAQIILLKFGTSMLAGYLVVLASCVLLIGIWTSVLANSYWRSILIRSSILVLALRFMIPVVVLINDVVYQSILSPTYLNSQLALENVEDDLQELHRQDSASATAQPDEGFFETISRFYERTSQSMNLSARFREYDAKLSAASSNIINLIVVFIFQTIVFPLIFLWLAIRLFRMLLNSSNI